MTEITVKEAVCEALFASPLQPSDPLTAEMVADAIGTTVLRLGPAGCASHMAQEFGDHPEAAADRMRWVRQLADDRRAWRRAANYPAQCAELPVHQFTKPVSANWLFVSEIARPPAEDVLAGAGMPTHRRAAA